jgi:hypothetical protein
MLHKKDQAAATLVALYVTNKFQADDYRWLCTAVYLQVSGYLQQVAPHVIYGQASGY